MKANENAKWVDVALYDKNRCSTGKVRDPDKPRRDDHLCRRVSEDRNVASDFAIQSQIKIPGGS